MITLIIDNTKDEKKKILEHLIYEVSCTILDYGKLDSTAEEFKILDNIYEEVSHLMKIRKLNYISERKVL